jgi:2-oxoglutarate ferredoxin oxidoreductase subunit alpha
MRDLLDSLSGFRHNFYREMSKRMDNMSGPKLIQGNQACAYGALAAGCRFFAGYPITPSTEIAEMMALELPKRRGRFIQMEDEIASISAVIGASIAGSKSMTATSGPGYSLMQESIGYASMAEVPCVIVNVMRGGPSTGLPTKVAQADVMQAKWGSHGDYFPIVLCPTSVRDCFDVTIRAFNLAERYRVPVTVLSDEVIGHMREMITLPDISSVERVERPRPNVPPEWYKHFQITPDFTSPMANFGEGYRFHLTGLTHDEWGFPTADNKVISQKLDKLKLKIERHLDDIIEVKEFMLDDARVVIFAYGSVAMAAKQAVRMARNKRFKAGLFQPVTIWPFPEKKLLPVIKQADLIIVAELNQGQLINEIKRVCSDHTKIVGLNRYDGELMTPEQILEKIREEH